MSDAQVARTWVRYGLPGLSGWLEGNIRLGDPTDGGGLESLRVRLSRCRFWLERLTLPAPLPALEPLRASFIATFRLLDLFTAARIKALEEPGRSAAIETDLRSRLPELQQRVELLTAEVQRTVALFAEE